MPPNSGVPQKDTTFLLPCQNSNIHLYTPSACSKPVQPPCYTTQGRNLPPPCLGPVLIRKWEQQPGTRVIPACHFLPLPSRSVGTATKKYPQQRLSSLFLQSTRTLLCMIFTIPSWGRGRVVTGGQKRQKKLIMRQMHRQLHTPSPNPTHSKH